MVQYCRTSDDSPVLMVGWAFFEAWWAHFANGYAAYQRFLVDHFFKMTLAGYISSAEATLLLNKKHHLQLMSIQYGKLRGFDDLNLLGSCPGDCKHDEVGLDGVQVGFRRSQYTCTQPWILNKVCISGLRGYWISEHPKLLGQFLKRYHLRIILFIRRTNGRCQKTGYHWMITTIYPNGWIPGRRLFLRNSVACLPSFPL